MKLYDFPKEEKPTRTMLLYASLGIHQLYLYPFPCPTIYEGQNRPRERYKTYFTDYYGYEIKGDINEMVLDSFGVLWYSKNNLVQFQYYKNSIDALAESFAPILGFSKGAVEKAVEKMVIDLGFTNVSIEKIVFSEKGYYDMQKFSKPFSGLMKLFLFWLASPKIDTKNIINQKTFDLFQTLFCKDINLDLYSNFTDVEMIEVFLSCFSIGSNDIDYFNLALALK